MIHYEKDDRGIVTLALDTPDRPLNLIDQRFVDACRRVIAEIEADAHVKGVIFTSAKKTFMVGADIDAIFEENDPGALFDASQALTALFRRLEQLGRPVVAALNGSALGGGLELALACHYRLALANDDMRLGFPEAGLGLMPGAGGVARAVRLAGIQKGWEWLSQNKQYTPEQGLADGMIHELTADMETMMARARAWIKANPSPQAPWDRRDFKIPGGGPAHPRIAPLLAAAPAIVRQETRGNYPAPMAILSAAVEGAQVDFDTACRIESRYFAHLAAGQVSKNMIKAFWYQWNEIKKGQNRPKDIPPRSTTRVGVLGAGMMGHGIAYVSAFADMDVVMVDVSPERAARGLARITKMMQKRVGNGRMTQAQADTIEGRIVATADYDQLEGCDLVIEAVFEERDLKAKVTEMAERVMDPRGVFASNTSTLPITGLAQASRRPQKFIGLHFFSPVPKMQLVEIVVGEKTDETTIAQAYDYVLALDKTPIVVNDSRGFYTTRVFITWVNEALALLAEGTHPQAIEMAGLQAGMPVGPLALLDELSLSLIDHIRQQTLQDVAVGSAEAGEVHTDHPGMVVVDKMLALGRYGRHAGAGFYEYADDAKHLWPGLEKIFKTGREPSSQAAMIERILFAQAVEAARCLGEGVVRLVAEANLGAIWGWGFPPFHGGPLQYIHAYGVAAFVARAKELASMYGARFEPPSLLVKMAEEGQAF